MFRFCLLFTLLVTGTVATAEVSGIPSMYQEVAQDNRIPAKLFFALILNESRSATDNKYGRRVLPWPWTVNYKGVPHFFQTRQQAFLFVQNLTVQGISNFDVGLGQINWYWHHKLFGNNLWDAFEPRRNLTVSARILRSQYERDECNTWAKAIGCYHRPSQRDADKKIAQKYALRVIQLWENI